jgi:protein-tyrosine phosphatase
LKQGSFVSRFSAFPGSTISSAMPSVVIDLSSADDPRDVVHRAVQALAEGKLVAFPTETVYGLAASALDESAVLKLLAVKGRRPGHALTLAIKSSDDALDYVPDISPLAMRLTRRCWPGPLTLVLEDAHPDSVIKQLPEKVQKAVCPEGWVGLRVPAHNVVLSVLRLTAGPLALSSANRAGEPESITAQQVVQALGDEVDLVLDDGRSKFGQPSSVVRVGEQGLQILRPGVFSEAALKRLSGLVIVFVCTGNTCRSPMAEVLMRRQIARRLNCLPETLENLGISVVSAGISAMAGGRSAPEAVKVMAAEGLDLSLHETQPLSERLVRYADLILTMTRAHREAILAKWPDAAPRTKLLCRDQSDVADPIGQPAESYRHCAEQIDAQLEAWVRELDFNNLPHPNS